jgi:hypothetical protein
MSSGGGVGAASVLALTPSTTVGPGRLAGIRVQCAIAVRQTRTA